MKKIILLAIIIGGVTNLLYSQNEHVNKANSFEKKDSSNLENTKIKPKPEHIYIICSSKEYDPKNEDGIKEGVMRIHTLYPFTRDTSLISYVFLSRSKNFEVDFSHWNFKIEQLKRPVKPNDKMSVVRVSKNFLSKIKPIDLDKEGPSMTREEVLALREQLVGKIIWVIDRRDATKDSIKLIQVETRIPDCF